MKFEMDINRAFLSGIFKRTDFKIIVKNSAYFVRFQS